MKKIGVMIIILLAGAVFYLVSYRQEEAQQHISVPRAERDHPEGDNFIEASTGDASSLNPLWAGDESSFDIIEKLYDSLLTVNKEGKTEGQIAKEFSYGTSENVLYVFTPVYEDIPVNNELPESVVGLSETDPARVHYYVQYDDRRFNALELLELYQRISGGEVINNIGKRELGDAKNIAVIGDFNTHQPYCLRVELNEPVNEEILKNWEKLSPEPGAVQALFEMQINFVLRDDVLFHDGKQLSADDVLFTYELALKSPRKSLYSNIYSVTSDKNTVSVCYKGCLATAVLLVGGMQILPKHVLENMDDPNSAEYNRNPIGTGPFKFEKWETDNIIILSANDLYYNGRPYLNKYVYRIIPDITVQYQMLKTQEIDYMFLTPLQYKEQLDDSIKANYNVFSFFRRSYGYIGYNLAADSPKAFIFRDKRIRHAITYAINRKKIISKIYKGEAAMCTGPFFPGSWAYNRKVTTFSYNKDTAKKLLDEAGWTDTDNDGIRDKIINGVKRKLSFEIMTNRGNEERKLMAEIIKSQLEEIGIEVQIRIFEFGAYFELIQEHKFEAIIAGWGLPMDPDIYGIWHSDSIEGGSNYTSYKNEEVDHLIDRARLTLNQEKRKEYYHKIHEIIAEEQPVTFLFVDKKIVAVHKRFNTFEVSEELGGLWPPLYKIWVEKDKQRY